MVVFVDALTALGEGDDEESAADHFSMELLTGEPSPSVITDIDQFSATQLAQAVAEQGPRLGIEPGVLAMCAGHGTGKWEKVYGALKMIEPGQQDVSGWVNRIAEGQLDWTSMPDGSSGYLRAVMRLPREDV